MEQGLIGLDEAAHRLGYTLQSMRRLVHQGELPAVRRGRRKLFVRIEDVDNYVRPYKPKGLIPKEAA